MEGKTRDAEEMQVSLVVEERMMVNFPLVPLPLVSFPWSSYFKVLSAKKKLNNHILEMHKNPTSYILFKEVPLCRAQERMKSGTYLLAPWPASVEGRFMGEFLLLLDGISVGDEDPFPASNVM